MPSIYNIQPPPEENNFIKTILNRVKAFFAGSFRTITSLFHIKNKIKKNNQAEDVMTEHINIANKAKDIIPEHIGIVGHIDTNNINDLVHINPETTEEEDYTLGEGSFGKVKIVAPQHKEKKIFPVVIKKQFIDNAASGIKASEEAKREHEKNKKFGDNSILDGKNDAIISKYKGESLNKLFAASNNNELSNEIKESICYQLLKEVAILHKQGILHADLKPENILIDAKGKLSIIDLAGSLQNSKKKQDPSATYKLEECYNTPLYSAPEVFTQKKITQYFDCWSIGAIMYEMYTGKDVLASCLINDKGIIQVDISKLEKDLGNANYRLNSNRTIPPKIKELIRQLLSTNPNKRPTIEQALNSNAFTNRKDIKKATHIDLNTNHDKQFKQLVRLEVALETAEKKNNKREIQQLNRDINNTKGNLRKLQAEIQRRNNL